METYLTLVLDASCSLRHKDELTLLDFFNLISSGFSPAKESPAEPQLGPADHFQVWEKMVSDQIADLHEMAETGALADDQRYFGIPGPRGTYWYNFDALTFLECGAVGYFGAWAPGDAAGRKLVTGQVAVLGEGGKITSVNAEDLEREEFEIPGLRWHEIAEFFETCQLYE